VLNLYKYCAGFVSTKLTTVYQAGTYQNKWLEARLKGAQTTS